MNKLKLENLVVESFATTDPEQSRGTVFGEQCTCPTACTCPGCNTCDPSHCNTECHTCGYSCFGSCDGTCGETCDGTCLGDATCNWNTVCEV